MTLDRRGFLGLSLGGALAMPRALPRWLESALGTMSSGERWLVVLELAGGNDGLNTLVPFEDDRYHKARPTIGLPRESLLCVDELNGLHPSLPKVRERLARGELAIVRDVGYPHSNLSHFTSGDIWATAVNDPLGTPSGWLGRWAEREKAPELALLSLGTDCAPRLVRGAERIPPAVPELAQFHFDAGKDSEGRARLRAFQALASAPTKDGERAWVRDAIATARQTSAQLSLAAQRTRPVEYPGTTIGRDLGSVADVIASGLPARVFHVQQTGYDTHTKQSAMQGALLGQLDHALDTFLDDLAAQRRLDQVLVLTTSEFGRRVAENGSEGEAGTDHGAASVLFLAGGRVRGGLIGAQPDLEHLDENDNLVHRVDFRSIYATVLSRWLGADDVAVLGAEWPKLPLLEVS